MTAIPIPFALRRLAVLVSLACVAASAVRAETPPKTHSEKDEKVHPITGRRFAPVMGVGGAAWLERRSREEEERPEIILKAMNLKPDDVVADVGCGTGYFARRIAEKIPEGKVYATDIQPEMIELLNNILEQAGVENVVPIVGEENDPKLPAGEIDWILLVDVYHEFQKPREMLDRMRESLSENGRVALVEYRLLGETAQHIKLEHRMSIEQVVKEWTPAGFRLVEVLEELPTQHLFVFEKGPIGAEGEVPRGLPFAP